MKGWKLTEQGWVRVDGVRVIPDFNHFKVVSRGGTYLSHSHSRRRFSDPIRYTSEEGAMRAANNRWPVKETVQ